MNTVNLRKLKYISCLLHKHIIKLHILYKIKIKKKNAMY